MGHEVYSPEGGRGVEEGAAEGVRCGVCQGEGLLFPLQYTGREEDELYNEPCPFCEGTGMIRVPYSSHGA